MHIKASLLNPSNKTGGDKVGQNQSYFKIGDKYL